MSKKNEDNAAVIAAADEALPEEAAAAERKEASAKRVYCGPTVRGVAKQYTVYGGIPAALEAFIAAHPEAGALLVRMEDFAQTRKRMETAGTAEAILYNKIKSEL